MNYLFIFTIGPVQPLIDNSRKGMDMYGGSKLLSETMGEAIQWIQKNSNCEVIFPLILEDGSEKTSDIPNHMVVRFLADMEEKLIEIAEKLTSHTKKYFVNRSVNILESSGIAGQGIVMAKKQLESFLETYWLYEKCDENDYGAAYQRLFEEIQAVKGVRMFSQINEPWGRKCVLFPEFNSIFAKKISGKGEAHYPNHVNSSYVFDITENDVLRYVVKEREAISAIALVKRLYDRPEIKLHSIRLMLLKSRVKDEVFIKLDIPQEDEIANAVYDIANSRIILTSREYSEEVLKNAATLYRYIQDNKITLASYYALVKFDGDSMGKVFLAQKTEKQQQELSERIAGFAKKVPQVILGYGGLPVFAGGEDFFGYLPLDTMFECMNRLQQEFSEIVAVTTFSAGIAIAHVMQPLKEVAIMADKMEKAAKFESDLNLKEKNAFSIGIIKRSGETVIMPRYKLNQGNGFPEMEDMWQLILLLKRSGCSRALFFQISRLFEKMADDVKMPERKMAEVLIRNDVSNAFIDSSRVSKEELVQRILKFYRDEYGVRGFLNTLNGIAFLAREVKE